MVGIGNMVFGGGQVAKSAKSAKVEKHKRVCEKPNIASLLLPHFWVFG